MSERFRRATLRLLLFGSLIVPAAAARATPTITLAPPVNATSGQMQAGAAADSGANPVSIVVDPPGRFAYTANFDSNNVSAFAINSATGALAPVAGSPFATHGHGPLSVRVAPSGRFAYVTNFNADSVSIFAINSATGALTQIGAGHARRIATDVGGDRFGWTLRLCGECQFRRRLRFRDQLFLRRADAAGIGGTGGRRSECRRHGSASAVAERSRCPGGTDSDLTIAVRRGPLRPLGALLVAADVVQAAPRWSRSAPI